VFIIIIGLVKVLHLLKFNGITTIGLRRIPIYNLVNLRNPVKTVHIRTYIIGATKNIFLSVGGAKIVSTVQTLILIIFTKI